MGRNVIIKPRTGGAAGHEILFGEVSIEPTRLRQDGTLTVLPEKTYVGIELGVAILEDVTPSPAGPEPEWAYKVVLRNTRTGRAWSELVGVPDGSGPIAYTQLPRYSTTIPDGTTQQQLQGWADLAQSGAQQAATEARRAAEAAERAQAPTDQMNSTLISDLGTQTRHALEDSFSGLTQYSANGWIGRAGNKLSIPTPDPVSSAGEAVHPSVLYFTTPWNGFRYWMGYTPYAGGSDQYEDPCIVASNDGTTWVTPSGLSNPLDDAPGGDKYNSDTHLIFHDGKLHLFWRYFDNTNVGNEEHLYVRTSTDGTSWTPKQEVYSSKKTVRRLVSPSFENVNGTWIMWAVDIVPASKPMVMLTAPELAGPWSTPTVCTVPVKSGKTPWHPFIKRVGSQFIGLLNDTLTGGAGARDGDLYLITSTDGVSWECSTNPVIPRVGPHHDNLYRGSFVPTPWGLDIWYSARVTGSPSVWSMLRTRLIGWDAGTAYASLSGRQTMPDMASAGGAAEASVTFPAGLFTKAPTISVSSANGRVNPAFSAVTKDGFTLKGFNWTGSNAIAPILHWTAIQTEL